MNQVIRWLMMGLGRQTKAEARFCAETPLEIPTDDAKLREAIEIIRESQEPRDEDFLD